MSTIVYSTAAEIELMDAAAERIASELRAADIDVESVSGAARQYNACIEIAKPNVTVSVGATGMHLTVADESGVAYGETRGLDDIAGLIADIKAA